MPDTTTYKYLMNFQSMDIVLVCMLEDSDGSSACIIDANKAARDALGYDELEFSGLDISAIDPSISPTTHFKNSGQIRFESEFITSTHRRIPVEVDIHAVSTNGSLVWILVGRDLTERKKIEADLERARMETADACKAKSRFLSNMSHELRTPLNGIMGMTQILLGTDLSKDQEEYLNLSLDATRHLTRILNSLLELSCIEAGGITATSSKFSLRTVLDTLVHSMDKQAARKGLKLIYSIDENVPDTVFGDSGKIRQILVNLMFNAIKFTKTGTITLHVSSQDDTCTENSNCEVTFSITDTGMGISPEQLDVIFESFTLGESIMTKQYGGLGLGLSISRQLADFLCGKISVESQLNKGSTFTFTVPLSEQLDCHTEDPCAQKDSVSSLRILLAEDEQVNSIMASRLLRKVGHEVAVVGNGQQAMEALGKEKFDLVLMDVQMPVINGVQATRFIRNGAVENVATDIPIIGLTAFAQPEEKKQFMEAGMDRIVTKPYEPEELMQAVAASRRI